MSSGLQVYTFFISTESDDIEIQTGLDPLVITAMAMDQFGLEDEFDTNQECVDYIVNNLKQNAKDAAGDDRWDEVLWTKFLDTILATNNILHIFTWSIEYDYNISVVCE